jgi:DNA (cytosine-5)-methyltransferase 1
MPFTVVDLFSGGGGFSQGFRKAGFKIKLALDIDPVCSKTYSMNFPETVMFVEDLRDVSGDDIKYFLGNRLDIVIGSPPCEPFTSANPNREKDPLDRLYRDPMGVLVLEYIRIVGELKPKIFIMENVPALNIPVLKDVLLKEFKYYGYERVYFNLLKAEDHGTPSRRSRLFISNVLLNPRPLGKIVTVSEAIGDISCESDLPNNECTQLSDRKLKRVARLRWGKALYYYQGANKMLPNYIKLDPFDIAPTVLGSSRFIHPYENRLLTVREQARLMGFPDHHIFYGDKDQQYNQVGEAVPPTLSYAIALYLLNTYFT